MFQRTSSRSERLATPMTLAAVLPKESRLLVSSLPWVHCPDRHAQVSSIKVYDPRQGSNQTPNRNFQNWQSTNYHNDGTRAFLDTNENGSPYNTTYFTLPYGSSRFYVHTRKATSTTFYVTAPLILYDDGPSIAHPKSTPSYTGATQTTNTPNRTHCAGRDGENRGGFRGRVRRQRAQKRGPSTSTRSTRESRQSPWKR